MSGFQSFDPTSVVQPNALFNLGDTQHQALANQQLGLQNQTTQNALNDAQTARDLAPAMASGDRVAIAQAAAASPDRASGVIANLMNSDQATRQQASYDMSASADLAATVLNSPPSERAQVYADGRAQLAAQGHQYLGPEQYPGDQNAIAMRNMGIPAAAQLAHQSTYPQPTPADPLYNVTAGSAPAAGNGGKTEQGTFSDSLSQSESSGNPASVNPQGYAGLYNYGTARLNSLGFYQPAQGESLNSNQWAGQVTIPGFPDVHTLGDFLKNPQAQQAVHVADMGATDRIIAGMPDAQGMSRAGLQAVAHIGGTTGMQRWVETGGKYNPADANGTTLTDYYQKFASGPAQLGENPYIQNGQPQSQSAAGQGAPPNAPSAPSGGTPATYANTDTTPPPGMPSLPTSGADSGAGPRVQTASLTGTNGMPQVMTDASSTPAATVPASVASGTPSGSIATGGPSPGYVPANPNALFSPGAPASAGPVPQNALASVGATAPQAQTTAPNPLASVGQPPAPQPAPAAAPGGAVQVPAGYRMQYVGGRPAGLVSTTTGLPYVGPKQEFKDGAVITSNPYTGQITDVQRALDNRRNVVVKNPDGTSSVVNPSGGVMATIGSPTMELDKEQWQGDQKDIREDSKNLGDLQANSITLSDQADLVNHLLSTGNNGAARANLAALAETYLGKDAAAEIPGLPDASLAQQLTKIQLIAAGNQERSAVGGHGSLGLTSMYKDANAGPNLLPESNKAITDLSRVISQYQQDYLAGKQQFINSNADQFQSDPDKNRYVSASHYDQQWQDPANNNKGVYFGAVQALNGKPFAEWSKGLKPDQVQRAIGVVQRTDPNTSLSVGSAASVPASAVSYLQANPNLAAQFDQKYGAGASSAVLGR